MVVGVLVGHKSAALPEVVTTLARAFDLALAAAHLEDTRLPEAEQYQDQDQDREQAAELDAEPETKAVQDSLEPAQAGTTARGHSWKRESVMGLDCKHV